jgi:hypothetical protein
MQDERDARHARRRTRAFPQLLHESLGQPPLHPAVRRVLVGVAQLLGDHVDRRWGAREAIADLLDQYGGQRSE